MSSSGRMRFRAPARRKADVSAIVVRAECFENRPQHRRIMARPDMGSPRHDRPQMMAGLIAAAQNASSNDPTKIGS